MAAGDRASAQRADAAVHAEVARLEAIVSTWRTDSELARHVAAGRGAPSPELAEVLRLALAWRERSGGAFEPGLAALGQRWAKAGQQGAEPSADELAAAVAALREPPFAFAGDEAVFRGPVTLDALAKGWIVDRAAHRLQGMVTELLVDDARCLVVWKGPGYAADATIERADGRYRIEEQRRGLWAVLDDLHKGRDCGPVWSLVIDASAVALAFVSIRGLWLLLYLKKRRRAGLLTALVGAAAVVAAFAVGVA